MENNGYATSESLFAKPPQRRFKVVEVGGHKFRIRSLTPAESNPWAVKSQDEGGLVDAGSRLIVLCAVDGDGQQVFCDDDVPRLQQMDSGFIARLARECQEHAGLMDDVALEEAEKN